MLIEAFRADRVNWLIECCGPRRRRGCMIRVFLLSPADVGRQSPTRLSSMIPGALTITGAALGVAIHGWLASGVLTPIAGSSIEYLFISATARSAVAIALVTATLVLAAHLAIRRLAARRCSAAALLVAGHGVHGAALLVCGQCVALLNLIPSVSRWFSVASYAIVDLRWWWIGSCWPGPRGGWLRA